MCVVDDDDGELLTVALKMMAPLSRTVVEKMTEGHTLRNGQRMKNLKIRRKRWIPGSNVGIRRVCCHGNQVTSGFQSISE